jgi:hypothetical protein
MADPRPTHTTYRYPTTLLNQPHEFPGAANAIYGSRGPQRAMRSYNRGLSGPPESIADHIDQAIARVAGLGPKQRLAIHNEMTKLCRDISFIRMIAEQTHGPHSEAAVMDSQGNVYR